MPARLRSSGKLAKTSHMIQKLLHGTHSPFISLYGTIQPSLVLPSRFQTGQESRHPLPSHLHSISTGYRFVAHNKHMIDGERSQVMVSDSALQGSFQGGKIVVLSTEKRFCSRPSIICAIRDSNPGRKHAPFRMCRFGRLPSYP